MLSNLYIGPIIGSEGVVIDSIRKETSTTINISKLIGKRQDGERIITIRGELPNIFKALKSIDQKVVIDTGDEMDL